MYVCMYVVADLSWQPADMIAARGEPIECSPAIQPCAGSGQGYLLPRVR